MRTMIIISEFIKTHSQRTIESEKEKLSPAESFKKKKKFFFTWTYMFCKWTDMTFVRAKYYRNLKFK